MSGIQRITILFGLLLLVSTACGGAGTEARTYDGEQFTFTIPAGWKTMEEVWDRPASPGREYYGLGVEEIVMIQYPPEQGQGSAFFAVASSSLSAGQDLESRFRQAYQGAVPEIQNAEEKMVELGGIPGYEITYERPWGEPWWKFRDTWLEVDDTVYVLSYHTLPNSFESYSETYNQILESFHFAD